MCVQWHRNGLVSGGGAKFEHAVLGIFFKFKVGKKLFFNFEAETQRRLRGKKALTF